MAELEKEKNRAWEREIQDKEEKISDRFSSQDTNGTFVLHL